MSDKVLEAVDKQIERVNPLTLYGKDYIDESILATYHESLKENIIKPLEEKIDNIQPGTVPEFTIPDNLQNLVPDNEGIIGDVLTKNEKGTSWQKTISFSGKTKDSLDFGVDCDTLSENTVALGTYCIAGGYNTYARKSLGLYTENRSPLKFITSIGSEEISQYSSLYPIFKGKTYSLIYSVTFRSSGKYDEDGFDLGEPNSPFKSKSLVGKFISFDRSSYDFYSYARCTSQNKYIATKDMDRDLGELTDGYFRILYELSFINPGGLYGTRLPAPPKNGGGYAGSWINPLFLEEAGTSSIAAGYRSMTAADCALAIGWNTKALARASISLGEHTKAYGEGSVSLGASNLSFSDHSFTAGFGSKAYAENSVAIGNNCQAGCWRIDYLAPTHPAGIKKTNHFTWQEPEDLSYEIKGYQSSPEQSVYPVFGQDSFAEGYRTKTGLDYAHAEGESCIAFGRSSHAEGSSTEANGGNSHTSGDHTIANSYCQFVFGRYNIPETEEGLHSTGVIDKAAGDYTPDMNSDKSLDRKVEIVGWGLEEDGPGVVMYQKVIPRNIRTLDRRGNMWILGDMEAKDLKIEGLTAENNSLKEVITSLTNTVNDLQKRLLILEGK